MQGALGLLETLNIIGQRCECPAAEREIGTALPRCDEARNHNAVEAEGGHSVTDALFDLWNDGPYGHAQCLKRLAPISGHCLQVLIDGIELREHDAYLRCAIKVSAFPRGPRHEGRASRAGRSRLFVAEGALFAKHRGVDYCEFGAFRDLKQLMQLAERERLEPSTPALCVKPAPGG